MMEYWCMLFDHNTLEQKSDVDIMQMCLWNTVLVYGASQRNYQILK